MNGKITTVNRDFQGHKSALIFRTACALVLKRRESICALMEDFKWFAARKFLKTEILGYTEMEIACACNYA